MTKLIFVRHGFSQANRLRVFAGCTFDAPLTEQGQAQGDTVSAFIAKNYEVDKILSSPMMRAKQTVSLLAERTGKQIEVVVDFREIFGGDWEGKSFEEIEKRYPEDYKTWKTDFANTKPTNGESFLELMKRIKTAVTKVAEENENKTVVVATHAGVIRALLAWMKKLSCEEIRESGWVPNASINEIVYQKGKWTVKREGFADYLGEKKTVLPPNI